jgi:hypothetical protein
MSLKVDNLSNEYQIKKKDIQIKSRQDILMISLTKFFNKKKNISKFNEVLFGNSKISLRVLDWFVTNYSKKNNIVYNIEENKETKKFIVYLDYKSQLKAYSKKQFDPFCRRERLLFRDINEKMINTTVGQLNFFRWAIKNKIVEYVENNLPDIEEDMNSSIKHLYRRKNKDKEKKMRRKRKELSISATKTVNKHDVKIIVKFE